MKDWFPCRLIKYLYHRFTKKKSWRVFYLCPQYKCYGGKMGYWLVSPRMPREWARVDSVGNSIFSHMHYDPGPDDYGIKEPEYPYISDSITQYPEGADDVAHYHWKYKSTLWGK